MGQLRFDDRVAVVTGAGGGLGKAYALLLANRGARVVVNDLGGSLDGQGADAAPAQQVVDEIKAGGGEATANYDSVAEWDSASNIINTAVESYGKIDILINNAGILRDKSFAKMELDDYRKVMSVHLDGTFYCTRAAFNHMKEQGYGRIVSTASAAGLYGNFGQVNYGAAKLGIAGMMNCLAQEGARYNVKANTIVPTAGTRLTFTVLPEEVIGRVKPEYVAPIVAWLCSEKCDESGIMISAGGGYFSRAAIVEAPGMVFDPDQDITVEMVVEKIDQVLDLSGAEEHASAIEHAGSIMSKINTK